MNAYEFNKIAGAVLFAALVVVGTKILVEEVIFPEQEVAKPGYKVAVKEEKSESKGGEKSGEPSLAMLLAKADADSGAKTAKQCEACHNVKKGAGAKIGPDLYNVLGRDIASFPGFDYSGALKKMKGTWDFQKVNDFITNPAKYAPGTKMGFAGLKRPEQRADVLLFLNKHNDHPLDLPKPEAGAKVAARDAGTSGGGEKAEGGEAKNGGKSAGGEGGGSILAAVAKADPKKGAKTAKQCEACHNVKKGAGAKIGPDLYGVVGRDVASVKGFDYSDALKSKKGKWDLVKINTFITNPAKYAPGTKMGFAGLKRESQRADVLAFLNQHTDTPQDVKAGGGNENAAKDDEGKAKPAEGEDKAASGKSKDEASANEDAGQQGAPEKGAEGASEKPQVSRDATSQKQADEPAGESTDQGGAPQASNDKQASGDEQTSGDEQRATSGEEQSAESGSDETQTAANEAQPAEQPAAEGDSAGGNAGAGGFAATVAKADAGHGEKLFRTCHACHNIKKGAGAKVGPDLYGVVGRPAGSVEGFDYSDAMKKAGQDGVKGSDGKPLVWTVDNLDTWLTKPAAFVPGTKMIYPGVRKEGDRADIIKFLHDHADDPAPLQ